MAATGTMAAIKRASFTFKLNITAKAPTIYTVDHNRSKKYQAAIEPILAVSLITLACI